MKIITVHEFFNPVFKRIIANASAKLESVWNNLKLAFLKSSFTKRTSFFQVAINQNSG